MNHWIILPVVLPAFLAPLIVLWARFDLTAQRVFSIFGMLVHLGLAVSLAVYATTHAPEVYRLGNWEAPFGISLVLDRLAALMLVLTSLLGLIVALYATGAGWDRRGWHFHSLLQFQMMGLNGAFLTGDAFNLFVFFEVLLIASYGLMIHSGGKDRLKAGVQYVVYNLAGSALFLIALGTIYSVTGTLSMADLAQKVAVLPPESTALVRVGAILLMLVFAVKAALVPFQFWLPGTYANAPGPVAALFAIMTKVGVYAIVRIYTLVFPRDGTIGDMAYDVLVPAAVVSMVIGMVGVLGARDLGRTVAYAVIGSVGTMMLAFAQFDTASTAAGLYYMAHSTFAAAALFLIVDIVRMRRGVRGLTIRAVEPMAGHGLIAAGFFAAAIAMAGMPPLSGFLGKLMIMDALRDLPGGYAIWAAILITSLIAIYGFSRAGSTVFWKAYSEDALSLGEVTERKETPFLAVTSAFLPLAVLVGLVIFAGPAATWMRGTAEQLFTPQAYISAVMEGAYERAMAAQEAASGHEADSDLHAPTLVTPEENAADHGSEAPAAPAQATPEQEAQPPMTEPVAEPSADPAPSAPETGN